jgi:hypothetical protein
MMSQALWASASWAMMGNSVIGRRSPWTRKTDLQVDVAGTGPDGEAAELSEIQAGFLGGDGLGAHRVSPADRVTAQRIALSGARPTG